MMSSIASPFHLKKLFPLSLAGSHFLQETRKKCKEILQRKDPRKVLILGPCSVHNIPEALVYADRLAKLGKEVEETFLLIMRVYGEKARTSLGWKGLVYDPYLKGESNLSEGLCAMRSLLIELTERGIPCATEFVDPLVAPYLEDLISWGFIGARTSSSQPHRQLASALSIPIGFKNSIDGNIETAIHGALVSSQSHTFLYPNQENQLQAFTSKGNPLAHIVLRGSLHEPNYTLSHIAQTQKLLNQAEVNTNMIIDCSHGNAGGDFEKQREVFAYLIDELNTRHSPILGIMLESYLKPGKQTIDLLAEDLEYGVSVTDPCIDWETTEALILDAHRAFQNC